MSSAKLPYPDPHAMFFPNSKIQQRQNRIEIRDLKDSTGLNVQFPLEQCITFKKYFQVGNKELNIYNFFPITVKVIHYETKSEYDGRSDDPQYITKLHYRYGTVDSFIGLTLATYNKFELKGEIPEWTTIRVADCKSTPTVTLSDEQILDITINEQHVLLNVGDCIQYTSWDGLNIIARISAFKTRTSNDVRVVNRIICNAYILETNKWNTYAIGLTETYFTAFEKSTKYYEWTSIVKLSECPSEKMGGGRRINRRTTKKARKNIRRYSRCK